MTHIEVMKQALEALEEFGNHDNACPQWPTYSEPEKYPACNCGYDKSVTSLRQAIEQAEKQDEDCQRCGGKGCIACDAREQEPVAWRDAYNACKCPDNEARCFTDKVFRMMQKYTSPQPQKPWVGLTHQQVLACVAYVKGGCDIEQTAKNIELKLKALNYD